jgi:hypothetical protein
MANLTLTTSEWKKLQREIERLKKRVTKLEKQKGTRRVVRKKGEANGHPKRTSRATVSEHAPRAAIPPNAKLWNLIGSVTLGYPTGTDNESIDRDLALEYGSTHAEE